MIYFTFPNKHLFEFIFYPYIVTELLGSISVHSAADFENVTPVSVKYSRPGSLGDKKFRVF